MLQSLITTLFCAAFATAAVDFTVTPEHPATMSVTVSAGSATLPGGSTVSFDETVLTFDAPAPVSDNRLMYYNGWNRVPGQVTATAPDNYATWWEPWQPWPAQGNPTTMLPRAVNPDNNYTDILGGLYRSVIPESVKVKNEAGTTTFTMDTDYKFNPEFGQIGNIGGALGVPKTDKITIDYAYIPQRLDLIQVNAAGTVSIKKGSPVAVCPALPGPDADHAALAGVYVARYDSFTVDASDINIIDPAVTEPVNALGLSRAAGRLASGGSLKITFFGASATDGAEAGSWWNASAPLTFRQQVVDSLAKRYPSATVSEVAPEAHVGGNTIDDGLPLYASKIKPAMPDVLFIMFGLNDCDGSQTGTAKNPVASFKEDIRGVVQTAKADGIEVLLAAPYNLHPFYIGSTRMPEYRQALLDVAADEDVALADIYTAWENIASHGIPPYSQLHNNKNHPGVYGHRLIANTILDCFETAVSGVHPEYVRHTVGAVSGDATLYTLAGVPAGTRHTAAPGIYLARTVDTAGNTFLAKTVVLP